jgi:hypothetical protein
VSWTCISDRGTCLQNIGGETLGPVDRGEDGRILGKIGCDDGRWMELAQDRVQWRAVVLAVLNLGVLLLGS